MKGLVPPARSGHQASAWWTELPSRGPAAWFHVDLSANSCRERLAADNLNDGELDRASRFSRQDSLREFVLCRAALRSVLCSRLDCDNGDLAFLTEPHGKPFAIVRGRAAPVSFNVSHSGDHGLIAIASQGRVGVDIETHDATFELPACLLSVFGTRERADFREIRDEARWRLRFYRYWTLKEALIKGIGLGFAMDTSKFDLPPALRRGEAEGVFRFPRQPTANWHLAAFGGRTFSAAVAVDDLGRGDGGRRWTKLPRRIQRGRSRCRRADGGCGHPGPQEKR